MVSPKKNTAKAPVNSGQFIVNFDPFGIESAAEKKTKKIRTRRIGVPKDMGGFASQTAMF